MDQSLFSNLEQGIADVVSSLPVVDAPVVERPLPNLPKAEGLAIPAQVNYVGKGCNVANLGFNFSGTSQVVNKLIRTGYLWEKVRVQGGAYGAFCIMDRLAGALAFVSYRDPNVAATVEAFDGTADYLTKVDITQDELEKSIIGAIGEIDSYQLPDAKGFTAMARYLTNQDDEYLQTSREEALATTEKDFRDFAEAVRLNAKHGDICVLGDTIAMENSGLDLEVKQVL